MANNPGSATRPTGRLDGNRDAMAVPVRKHCGRPQGPAAYRLAALSFERFVSGSEGKRMLVLWQRTGWKLADSANQICPAFGTGRAGGKRLVNIKVSGRIIGWHSVMKRPRGLSILNCPEVGRATGTGTDRSVREPVRKSNADSSNCNDHCEKPQANGETSFHISSGQP